MKQLSIFKFFTIIFAVVGVLSYTQGMCTQGLAVRSSFEEQFDELMKQNGIIIEMLDEANKDLSELQDKVDELEERVDALAAGGVPSAAVPIAPPLAVSVGHRSQSAPATPHKVDSARNALLAAIRGGTSLKRTGGPVKQQSVGSRSFLAEALQTKFAGTTGGLGEDEDDTDDDEGDWD